MSSESAGGADRLVELGAELLAAVDAAVPGWVTAAVDARVDRLPAGADLREIERQATAVAESARRAVRSELGALLNADIDDQRTTPLSILREAVRFPTAVLAAAGAAPVERDDFSVRMLPDDLYDLAPATFADISPDLVGPATAWGAAKAFVHLSRRRGSGSSPHR